jgi:hypothetical protein
LGLIAAGSLGGGSLKQATVVIETLEQSVRGFGGEQSFGAFYGMALICQGLQCFINFDALQPVVSDNCVLLFAHKLDKNISKYYFFV